MKKILVLITVFTLFSCCNDDDSTAGLPPETQTGAGTFACKINGESFIDTSGGDFNCFYQYSNGGWYFNINGKDEDYKNSNLPWSISLGTIEREIEEGQHIILEAPELGNAAGVGFFDISPTDGESSFTSNTETGVLTITKFDQSNYIVSGTFSFDVKHPTTGEIVEIREGRFDTHYFN